jgi:hypothetical protein
MSPKEPLQLTFGIEAETYWQYSREHAIELNRLAENDPTMKQRLLVGTYIMYHLHHSLADAGIAVQVDDENFEKGYKVWTMEFETLYHSDLPPEDQGATRDDFEVVSRILMYNRECFDEVRKVFHVMGKYKNPPFAVNTATGLHIHVGSPNQPYTLEWLKGFTQLVTAFEHEIEALHVDHRVRGENGQVNGFCNPPTRNPILLPRLGPVVGIAILEGCEEINSLQQTFSWGHRQMAYNLLNIGNTEWINHNPKQTIEFRQHAGSLDAEEILNWATFAGALVQYAYDADHTELLTYCMTHLADYPNLGRYSVFDLMEKVGVGFLVPYYKPRANLQRPRQAMRYMPQDRFRDARPDTQWLYDLLVTDVEEESTASSSGKSDESTP